MKSPITKALERSKGQIDSERKSYEKRSKSPFGFGPNSNSKPKGWYDKHKAEAGEYHK